MLYGISIACLPAQILTQSLSGVVEDEDTEIGLAQAGIAVYSRGEIYYTQTDENGNFVLNQIPVGTIRIACKHKDYEPYVASNIRISSGNSLVLTIRMQKKAFELEEVIISAARKQAPGTISQHQLNMALGNNFAGALGDPARMMARFAGVTQPDDLRNNLVIRGNSPVGVKWSIEGITTINPNHFATVGNSGGGVNILNPYTLKNIRLYTGAFPAEFGNANSGMVEVALRNGHLYQRKSMGRTNIVDVELATEGPIKKGKSSYLLAFRRSNLDFAYQISSLLKGYLGNAPKVYDGTFHLFFQGNKGQFHLYGIGGNSQLRLRNSLGNDAQNLFRSRTLVSGLKHVMVLGKRALWTGHVAYSNSFTGNGSLQSLNNEGRILEGNEHKLSLSGKVNFSVNSRHHIKGGVTHHFISSRINRMTRKHPDSSLIEFNFHKTYHLTQAFVSWKWRMASNISLNTGLHSLALSLNHTYSIDPRIHLSWQVYEKNQLALGWGIHSQVQPTALYATGYRNRYGENVFPNFHLQPGKSHHVVLSYRTTILQNVSFTSECYYLYHYQMPIFRDVFQPKSFSGLNLGYEYGDDFAWYSAPMQSTGTGRSYGVEITVEKPFVNRYYVLFTTSLYDAKYRATDQVLRNTA
ncbi:MAG: carboxypeptidase-like regulatory domain-containing protein, partial [Bacteroidetes bacterium]